ncbi:MAG: hypothetical protein FWB83_00520 [Treponema sp.]|nr:hypothetical protein [Treponema sp.]
MYREKWFFIAALITVVLVVSCGSTASSGPIVGAEGVPMPTWVRTPRAPTVDTIYFIGEGRDGRTATAKRQNARASGLQALSEWKDGIVASTLRDWVNESGETGNTQSLESLQNAVVTRARANTAGFLEVETWVNPDGNYIMLFSYPKNDFRQDFRSATNTFVRNESAAYAEFRADEVFRILERNLE